MRLVALLQDQIARLDARSRRILVFGCAVALALYAQATVAAARRGDLADLVAGLVMLGGIAAVSAMAWSAPRRRQR